MTTIYGTEGGKNPVPLPDLYIDLESGAITVARGKEQKTAGGGSDTGISAFTLTPGETPPALVGRTADGSFDTAYTYTSDDACSSASWYGAGFVTFLHWTPTVDGTVTLLPPADPQNPTIPEVDYIVFQGDVLGTDVPSRDGSGAMPSEIAWADIFFPVVNGGQGPPSIGELAQFNVTAGQVYTVAVVAEQITTPGATVDVANWIRSTQLLGGQAHVLPAALAPVSPGALAQGSSAAGAYGAHAEGAGHAQAPLSHAEGLGQATGNAAHAEGTATASGTGAHAEGYGGFASQPYSHAEGDRTLAANLYAHAEGYNTQASGLAAHAEGNYSSALGNFSHAEGRQALAREPYEHAQGGGEFVDGGGRAQYSRLVFSWQTTDASGGATGDHSFPVVPVGESWTIDYQITARAATDGDASGDTASWRGTGVFRCTAGDVLSALQGTIDTSSAGHWADVGAADWAVIWSVIPGAPPQLSMLLTGQAGRTINWAITWHITRTGGPA